MARFWRSDPKPEPLTLAERLTAVNDKAFQARRSILEAHKDLLEAAEEYDRIASEFYEGSESLLRQGGLCLSASVECKEDSQAVESLLEVIIPISNNNE